MDGFRYMWKYRARAYAVREAVGKLFATKLPPVERAGVGARGERDRGRGQAYGEIDPDELDDAFTGRRSRKQQAPPRQEEKPEPKSEPNYDTIWTAAVHLHSSPFAASSARTNRRPLVGESAGRPK